MTRILSLFVVAALSGACDTQDPAAAKPAAKDDKATARHGDAPAASAAAPAQFDSLSSCLNSCDGPDLIPTNRATCRLNCDSAYGAPPRVAAASDGPDPVGQAASCMNRCYASDVTADACAGTCKTSAASATPAPAPDVLDRLGTCIRTCHADKSVLPTNRATCELNCTQLARVAGPAQPATPAG